MADPEELLEPGESWVCEIDPEMIWATRTGEDEVRLYINEDETLAFDNGSAMAVLRALINVLGVPEGGNGDGY